MRELRTTRKLTQERLASRAELTTATVAKLELASNDPTWPTVRAVVEALGATWTEFGQALDTAEKQR